MLTKVEVRSVLEWLYIYIGVSNPMSINYTTYGLLYSATMGHKGEPKQLPCLCHYPHYISHYTYNSHITFNCMIHLLSRLLLHCFCTTPVTNASSLVEFITTPVHTNKKRNRLIKHQYKCFSPSSAGHISNFQILSLYRQHQLLTILPLNTPLLAKLHYSLIFLHVLNSRDDENLLNLPLLYHT